MILATIALVMLLGVCLTCQAFFSGSEMAMVHADRVRLATQASEGHGGAKLALAMLEREDTLLGTCLIGTNLSLVTGATLVTAMFTMHGVQASVVAALVFAPIALVCGEALPKTVTQHYSTELAPYISRPLRAAQTLFAPVLLIVTTWSRLLARVTGSRQPQPVTRRDIVELLDADRPTEIDPDEKKWIRRVFAISETSVEDCMTPLVEVDAVPREGKVADAIHVATRSGHSRLVVYEERIDNIVGLLHVHDLLLSASSPDAPLAELVDEVKFVPESKRVDDLLYEMRAGRDHLVVVVDEYGGSVGVVTVEDLLEEVVGEIRDERDRDEPGILRLGEREWRVPARVEIEELEDVVGIDVPEGDYETVAGLILSRLGRIPDVGQRVRVGDLRFTVEEASDRAIVTVRLTVPWTPGT